MLTFDPTVNLPTVVTLIIAIIGVVIWLVRLEGKADNSFKSTDTLSKTLGALEALVQLHHQEFQMHRLEAAEKYVTRETLIEIKRDLSNEMKDMERRLEVAFDRAFKSTQER